MELPYQCCEHCVWAHSWHHPVFWNHQGSLSLPLWGKLEGLWGYWTMILSASSWKSLIAFCLILHFSQLQKRTIDSVFVQGIMQQYTQFFFFFFLRQRTLFNTSGSRPPNYGLKKQLPHRKVLRVEAPTCVDCEGPFIAACSFNWNWYYMIRKNKNVSDWGLYWKWKQ